MSKIYFYRRLSLALRKAEPASVEPLEVQARISPSGKNQFVNVTFTIDTGASSGLISRSKLQELGIEEYQVLDTIPSEMANGSTENMDVALFDVQLFTQSGDRPLFLEVPISITEGDAQEILLGRDLLGFFKIGIGSGNKLTLFQPDNQMLEQLPEWSPQTAKMGKIKFALDEVLKDASIQKPLEPIESKKPELKAPQPPSLKTGWKIPPLPKLPKI